jgi:uncharacterized protein
MKLDNRKSIRPVALAFTTVVFCLTIASSASAGEIRLQPPGDREFIRDLAGLIDLDAEVRIEQICDSLLTDKATPIIVITIDSMAKHTGRSMRIETFATLLFDQWGIEKQGLS